MSLQEHQLDRQHDALAMVGVKSCTRGQGRVLTSGRVREGSAQGVLRDVHIHMLEDLSLFVEGFPQILRAAFLTHYCVKNGVHTR